MATAVLARSPSGLTGSRLRVGPRELGQRTALRVRVIWGLLFFDVIEFAGAFPTLLTIPEVVAKLATQLSLVAALGLALTLRPQRARPNVVLTMFTALATVAFAVSISRHFGTGSIVRGVRLFEFVATLWLISPWWGRRDLLILRAHMRALCWVIGSVLLGLLVHPGGAFWQGRLYGSVWPIPPPQVAHYLAVLLGLSVLSWYAGYVPGRVIVVLAPVLLTLLLLTRTRTALLALFTGLLVASLSLCAGSRRVRRTTVLAGAVMVVVALAAMPEVLHFLARGQDTQQLSALTGRTDVWQALVSTYRPRHVVLFGYGLSNKSFNGLPIDNTWLATYQDEGLFGDLCIGLILLLLLVFACCRLEGTNRAVALFLVIYCITASFTEVTIGDASPYLLDIAVAASLLATPGTGVGP